MNARLEADSLLSPNTRSWRGKIEAFVEHPRIQALVIAAIVVIGVALGLETMPSVLNQVGCLVI